MIPKQKKYNELLHYLRKAIEVIKELNEDDLTIISEQLKIARAEGKIKELLEKY